MPCDPFLIVGPAIVSFSGGRTSAYMLRRIIDAHGGVLPPDVHTVFANTGREMPATLDFVQRCSTEWNVPVTWLEFTARKHDGFRVVNHNSASRNGEPFASAIDAKRALPNPVQRWCTSELKVLTIARWVRATYGYRTWANVVGLRADEAERRRDDQVAPLIEAGITKPMILDWWRAQAFDLTLAGPWEGNCDGCYLKSRAAIMRMLGDYPQRMCWWADQEAKQQRTFRTDRDAYATMARHVAASPRLIPDALLADTDGCGVWCGT